MKYNSTENQRIKDKLVQREVVACASQMVSEVSEKSEDLQMEILEKFHSTPDYGQAVENHLYENEDAEQEILEHFEADDINEIEDSDICDFLDLEPNLIEPYEFWIVSDWFGEKLENVGEIVDEFLGFTIWARTCSGQAISLDWSISKIAEDMEILEGQANQW